MQLMSGTEIYNRAIETIVKPDISYQEIERCFNDFALLLDTAIIEKDLEIGTLWYSLGCASQKRNHRALALLCFQEALKTKPYFIEAINNMGYCHKKLHQGSEANAAFKRVIDLIESGEIETSAQNKAEFYTNYGSMFVATGTPDEAIALFDKAAEYADIKMAKYNRALVYLEKGDYVRGFEGWDEGDRVDKLKVRHYGHENLPVWNGEPGKTVVVVGEQGIGDELMFGTILPDIMRDCKVILDAHPRLADMFRRSFPHIDVYGTRKDGWLDWGKRYQLDAKILLGSLPKFYRHGVSDFPKKPYLIVDPALDTRYAEKLASMGDKPKIGISWRGGIKQTGSNHRYIPLEQWLDILKLDCDFISLQYDKGITGDVEKFNTDNNVKIHHWPEMLENYEHTAALVNNLDLVISVPQSVVHLAGVLGTLTWQLVPIKTLWQAGVYGQDMPWYDCVSNKWQATEGRWDSVLMNVKDELCSLLQMSIDG